MYIGVAPIAAGGVIAAGAAIGGLLGLLQNSLDDDWAEMTVFKSHGRDIHRAMLAIQCLLGGAQTGSPLLDADDAIVCPGGTRPACQVSNAMLDEWRALRDGFGRFYGEVASAWGNPSNAEAQRLKDYALAFYRFYERLSPKCREQGVDVPVAPTPPKPIEAEQSTLVQSLKYGAWIVGGVSVIWLSKVLYDVFKKGA